MGFAFLGDLSKPLPAGNYFVYIVNKTPGQADATINLYSEKGLQGKK